GRVAVVDAVVGDYAEAVAEGSKLLEPCFTTGAVAVQEDERLPLSVLLIVDVRAVDLDPGHAVLPSLAASRDHHNRRVLHSYHRLLIAVHDQHVGADVLVPALLEGIGDATVGAIRAAAERRREVADLAARVDPGVEDEVCGEHAVSDPRPPAGMRQRRPVWRA